MTDKKSAPGPATPTLKSIHASEGKKTPPESETLFQSFLDNSPYGILIADTQGRILNSNSVVSKHTGYSIKELLEMSLKDVTPPEYLEKESGLINEILEGKRDSFRMQKRIIHKQGGQLWLDVCVFPLKDKAGNISKLLAMGRALQGLIVGPRN